MTDNFEVTVEIWESYIMAGNQTGHELVSLRMFFVYGLAGGVFAIAAMFVGTMLLEVPFPPTALFLILIALVPGSMESIAVETFHEYVKYSAFVFACFIFTLLYAVVAVSVGLMFRKDLQNRRNEAVAFAAIIPGIIEFAFESLLSPSSSALATLAGWMMTGLLFLIVNLFYGAFLVRQVSTQGFTGAEDGRTVIRKVNLPISPTRREFFKKAAIAAGLLAMAGLVARVALLIISGQLAVRSDSLVSTNPKPEPVDLSDVPTIFYDSRVADLVRSEVTDSQLFYRVDIDPVPPQLNFDQWALKVYGTVNRPLTLGKANFLALPTKDEYATLECVSNTINIPGGLIGNAKWTGVPLSTILNRVGVAPDAKYVVFRCADGYTIGIPLDNAMHLGALLAYKMNDQMLSSEHGFPLRAILPGKYGMMNAKWVTEIQLVDFVYRGYWQLRGWSNDATIKTVSFIYYPRPRAHVSGTLPIAGIAFAGDREISRVEVSFDNGSTWKEAILKKPRSPYSWVLWAYEWTPTVKGSATITVRAYDGTGEVQDSTERLPFPDGASGYNYTVITVK